jgi:hypothetical protein
MENKTIALIFGIVLIISNGAQYMLNDTGKDLRCYSGWDFQETGEYEGQYSCETSTGDRHSYCSDVRDSKTGRNNFWCDEAIPVFIEHDDESFVWGQQYKCTNDGCIKI